jgi:ferredoxin
MEMLPQLFFIVALIIAGFLLARRIKSISALIKLGRTYQPIGDASKRFQRMLLFAFGQKKMFERPIVGIMHFIIYAGFLLINIEVLEIIIDGIFGTHRIFAPVLGSFYGMMINFFEFLALGVIITCVIFLIRRNALDIKRFKSAEMGEWPKMDANLILIIEIILMVAILSMNATDQVLQERGASHYHQTGQLFISSMLMPIFEGFSVDNSIRFERFFWWIHILGIFGFAVYVTYSKHLHIFLAFPNTYFTSIKEKGHMINMPEVTSEVKIMLGLEQPSSDTPPPSSFGAKDVNGLSRKSLMEAFSCTECGRCTSQCPANLTGKKLSPRKIMMDTRDRLEDVSKSSLNDGKSLLGDYITEEEIMACTSCNACVEACPVSINPLDIITELRRYKIMEESKMPIEWTSMMTNIENNAAPWAFPASDRFNWAKDHK